MKYLAGARTIWSKGLGIILSMDNSHFFQQEQLKHETAKRLGLLSCQQCGFCCLQRSCISSPKELKRIAQFLRITIPRLIKSKMVIDLDNEEHLYPLWANESQLDMVGKFLPYNRTYDRGYCIFFDRETHNCLIYPVRPVEARLLKCWDGNKNNKYNPRHLWTKDILLELCPSLHSKKFMEEVENVQTT